VIDAARVGRVFREESGRSVAALIRILGDIDLAEDAVQDAFAVALRRWPEEGLPPNPGGWITTTARNQAIDRLRRESRGRQLVAELARLVPGGDEVGATADEEGPVDDDRLRLIFTCCHPALAGDAQVALTLRLLGGLSTEEVASAFLVAEPTMAKRLVRAKHKIKAARIPYRVPADHDLPRRLPPVLAVIYLIYNAGVARADEPLLCAEAIRLARILLSLMPDEAEVAGLLGLLLLTESRRPARLRADGSLAVLAEQDRALWDTALVEEGQEIVRRCLRRDQPGPYQLQAAINAVHADAATFEQTDWSQIVTLYDRLLELNPTRIVALNRAIAIGELEGPAVAFELVEQLDLLEGYQPFHAVRADLLQRLGRAEEAASEYERAAALAPTEPEREFLRRGGRAGRGERFSRGPVSEQVHPPTDEGDSR
jgi:RNA polymerase sigma-70 factor, ECF subfamily